MPTTSSSKASGRRSSKAPKNQQSRPRDVVVRVVPRIADVSAAAWDACANPTGLPYHPFTAHAFLEALEESGSATAKTGWAPQHLVIEEKGGALAACLPLYVKSHSYGEYVFDHGWAEAFHRAGGRYYPKLLAAVPFTPATGRRFLVRPGTDEDEARSILIAGALALVERHDLSSFHLNFVTPEEWRFLGAHGFLLREDQQFHWLNERYSTFDDFLAELAARKRKQIKRERRAAAESGIALRWLTGRDLGEAHWDAFFSFYMDTGSRKWGRPYLTRKFFSLVGTAMPEHILLVLCERDGRAIAGALNFIGGDTLYGRYWGAVEDHPFLHFEACYYQAIEFAIAHGLKRVEAGAQGPHKLARGYRPVETLSAHWIADPGLRDAISRYLVSERRAVEEDIAYLRERAPFRRDRAPILEEEE
jgi:predicted N-acyltransferase